MSANLEARSAPTSKPQKSPKLREVRFEDHAKITALAAKYNLRIESYPDWIHLWSNNPAFREVQDKFPMGWVLETGGGEISGYLGNIPLNYELDGKRLLAATTRAWVVDTPYRTYSPLLLGTYFQQANVDLFLSTTVNAQSAPAYTAFQSTRVPVGVWDQARFWITHYPGFVESFLRKKGATGARALSYPLSAAVFLRDRFKGSTLRGNSTVQVRPCASFDERFEAFWANLRQRKSHLLLGVRSQGVLAWHFHSSLEQNRAWIYVVEGELGLVAYGVFRRHDYKAIGLTRMRLTDFQCLDQKSAPDVLLAMLEAAMDRSRQESIHMLEVIGLTPALEERLEPASPHRRSLATWLYFYKARSPWLADKLQDPSVWEPSLFDGDSSF